MSIQPGVLSTVLHIHIQNKEQQTFDPLYAVSTPIARSKLMPYSMGSRMNS